MACLEHGGSPPPTTLWDTTTMTISLDNQGIAVLTVTILQKSASPITNSCVNIVVGGKTFKGYLESDTPQHLSGTDYFEHNLVARGMIC